METAPGQSLDSGSEEDQPGGQPAPITLHLPLGLHQALALGELTAELIWELPCFAFHGGVEGLEAWKLVDVQIKTIKRSCQMTFPDIPDRQVLALASWPRCQKSAMVSAMASVFRGPGSVALSPWRTFLRGSPLQWTPRTNRRLSPNPRSATAAANFLLINRTFPL